MAVACTCITYIYMGQKADMQLIATKPKLKPLGGRLGFYIKSDSENSSRLPHVFSSYLTWLYSIPQLPSVSGRPKGFSIGICQWCERVPYCLGNGKIQIIPEADLPSMSFSLQLRANWMGVITCSSILYK